MREEQVQFWRKKGFKVKHIPMKKMRDVFRFHLIEPIYHSSILANVTEFESQLQQALNHHPLGVRCWRHVAMGQQDDQEEGYYYSGLCVLLLDPEDDVVFTYVSHFSKSEQKVVKRIDTITLGKGDARKTLVVVH